MYIIHSFLRSFKDRLRYFRLDRYRPIVMITAYTLIAVILILSAGYYYGYTAETVTVQAKASYDNYQLEEEETDISAKQEADDVATTIEDKITNYMELSTLDGMLNMAAVQVKEIQNAEDEITKASENQNQIKTDIARENAKAERKVELEKEEAEKKAAKEASAKAAAKEAAKKEVAKKEVATTRYVFPLSRSERTVLERIVQAEAGNQDIIGRMLVANVVLNRCKSSRFPNTVKAVVFQHSGRSYQFSPAKSGSIYTVRVTAKTKEAVERVLKGEDYSKGALFFVARRAANRNSLSWFDRKLTRLFTHGGHTFYR